MEHKVLWKQHIYKGHPVLRAFRGGRGWAHVGVIVLSVPKNLIVEVLSEPVTHANDRGKAIDCREIRISEADANLSVLTGYSRLGMEYGCNNGVFTVPVKYLQNI